MRWSVYRVPSGILPADGRVLAGMWQGFPGTVDDEENDMPHTARKDSLYMEQALQTMIEQMVLALDQAIADAQTAEDISYFAFDGELLSQSGAHYIYQFKIRVQWEPEENSRVYVEIDKQAKQKLAARVVSLVGTTLMLSTREPIPAQFLKKVTLIEDTVWLLERQREVLKAYLEGQLEEAPGGYAAKVLDLQPVRYGTRRVRGTFGPFTPMSNKSGPSSMVLAASGPLLSGREGPASRRSRPCSAIAF